MKQAKALPVFMTNSAPAHCTKKAHSPFKSPLPQIKHLFLSRSGRGLRLLKFEPGPKPGGFCAHWAQLLALCKKKILVFWTNITKCRKAFMKLEILLASKYNEKFFETRLHSLSNSVLKWVLFLYEHSAFSKHANCQAPPVPYQLTAWQVLRTSLRAHVLSTLVAYSPALDECAYITNMQSE